MKKKENTYLLQATQQQARDLVYLKIDKAGRILTKKATNSKYKSRLIQGICFSIAACIVKNLISYLPKALSFTFMCDYKVGVT